ncbi:lactonase family protein [Leptospira vanthielii]|uniref:3-carboxymuconate cyclase n=1 Tax=Leptospira vanthielii TaxID=293085 RepID=A0ABY2NTZ8_9LEPT|nr:beta-propeller fold lactonase family protein [Leptospira vanthielii]TGM61489.1 3-carboxymuconate cyclase [Leptospira vanthielii]
MKNQINIVNLFLITTSLFLHLQCAPAKLNSTCDPESESFAMTALLEFGSTDGSFLCPILSGFSPLRLDYGTDFFVMRQEETIGILKPVSSEPITHCESSPSLPLGIVLDESNCALSGTPLVGMNATKFMITAKSQHKQITIPLVIKSLFIPKFAFVANIGSGLINSYTINATSGVLGAGGFVAAGGGPESMALSTNQKYLTVANRNTNDLSQFSINPLNGNLTIVETISSGGTIPIAVVYHPSKDLLYIRNSDNIATFSVSPQTGDLTLINTTSNVPDSSGIAMDPLGNFLYVASFNANLINSFGIDPVTGFLNPNPIHSIPSGSRPRRMVTHANGKTMYVAYENSSNISTFQIDVNTGSMSSIFPDTPSTGVVSGAIVSDPVGKFVYMANRDTNTISMYATSSTNGELIPMSPNTVATGNGPLGIDVDPSGKFLYNTNMTDSTAGIFTINQANGNLSPNGSIGTSTSPAVIVTAGSNP